MTEDNAIVSSEATNGTRYTATFMRGSFYGLRDLSWEPGRTLVISEAQMIHLSEYAVEYVCTGDGEILERERFTFEPYDGPEAVGFKFPTEAEIAKAEATAKAIERGRRNAAARAAVDAEMADWDRNYTPTVPQVRSRAKP